MSELIEVDMDACAKFMRKHVEGDLDLLHNHEWTEAMMTYLNNNHKFEKILENLIEEKEESIE
jgi:hypothetical protein